LLEDPTGDRLRVGLAAQRQLFDRFEQFAIDADRK